MKKIIRFLIVINLILPVILYAQEDMAKCKIAAVARFSNDGVELRWIPDNKTILRLGFDNSFTIERSELGTKKFVEIAKVKVFSMTVWDSLKSNEKNPETQSNLDLAMEFLYADKKTEQKELSLDKGIAELNEQKSKEDMVYAIFVMTAMKETKVATALGLGFIDKTVKAGGTYVYRIKLNAKSPIYEIVDGEVTIKAIVDSDKYKNEVFVYPGDKQLSFAWSSKPELAGYFVERAAEGEEVFKPLNTTPFYASSGSGFEGPTNGSYMDDSLKNYKWYTYRFYGNTAFGEKVMFAEVKGMPRDLTPPNDPIIKQPKQIKPKEVLVEWDINGDLSDLKGFIISRSVKEKGEFQILHKKLLTNKTRNYIDTGFNPEENNYYIISAIDTAGNLSSSFPAYVALNDSTPPSKPQILSAIIDSLGIVTLKVKLGKEKDLKGYMLFKANSPEHEFSVIEEAYKKDTADSIAIKVAFADTVTLQSLTPKIYYRVKAIDFHYNQSEFSEIIAVTRPDTIPPVTPLFNNVIVREKEIELHFVPSSSEDVKEHIIYRKTEMEAKWEMLKTAESTAIKFIDTTVTTGITYYYSIRAKDLSGLYSKYASAVYGKPYDTGIRPPIEKLSAIVEKRNIILKWEYPALKTEHIFVIYKKDDKGQLKQYDTTKEKTYTDKNTNKENYYAVKVVTNDGGQSKISAVLGKIIE
jgi:hypothetical protein